jgi:hypothetical protein
MDFAVVVIYAARQDYVRTRQTLMKGNNMLR